MNAIQAIVLGVVQGLTEFLPISSSGHLRIVPALFGWDDPGAAFTAVIQLGTMAAVLLYFRADLWRIASAWLRSLRDRSMRARPRRPDGLVHHPRHDPDRASSGWRSRTRSRTKFRNLELIGTTLIVFGFVMLAAEAVSRRDRPLREITRRDGILIGLAQALALVPGVSRSGATISAGLFLNFDRAAAARYSFLLSVPAVVLSGLFELRHAGEGGLPSARRSSRRCSRSSSATRRSRSCCVPRAPHDRRVRRLPRRARRDGDLARRGRRDQLTRSQRLRATMTPSWS